jgi:hypothetical protein
MTTYARPLAVWLAAASDDALTALFRARGVSSDVGWSDFFDAAEALLDAGSVERALTGLPRDDASALLAAARGTDSSTSDDARARLIGLALLDATGRPLPPVAEAVSGRATPPAEEAAEPEAATEAASARAAERAFTTAARIADMLFAAHEAPLGLLATGALGAGEKKRLAEAGIDPGDVEDLRAIAEDAGLLRASDRHVQFTVDAAAWLGMPFADRWTLLASAYRDALPHGIRDARGWTVFAEWPHAYPWDAAWPAQEARLRVRARLLGLLASDESEPAWARTLRQGEIPDTTVLERLVPAEVDQVFLQNDLTAIPPGPLLPAREVRLRTMAERDSAQSSSYRFTANSITRALVEGETEASVLEFLSELSLTGLPQPLSYLVSQTARRHGLVRVSEVDGRTQVISDDDALLEAIAVDRGLRPIGLVRDGDALTSRVGVETVYWALTDARYPATLVDASGAAVSPQRTPPAETPARAPLSYGPLIERLRARQGPDADAAWLDRELDAAVRAKAVLVVDVGMPDGSVRQLLLEATGLGGGRLRGRDRNADVERTLPVRSIRAVRIAAESAQSD